MAQIILGEPTPLQPPIKFAYRSYAPMALLTVAAPLVAAGYEIKIVDQRISLDWKQELLDAIDDETLCVGITSMTGGQLLYALEASRVVKENTTLPVVWGGIHASLQPAQTVGHPWIDFVVQGEGEETFLSLIRTLEEKERDFNIEGLWYKVNGEVRSNPPRPFLDMDLLYRIPFELVNVKEYNIDQDMSLNTSRGCAFRCSFCYNHDYSYRKWRSMSVSKVLEDLTYYIERFNPRKIIFRDDNFFQDLKRSRQICDGIIQKGFKISWRASCRIDAIGQMTDQDLQMLKTSGFEEFYFGIESGSPRVLEIMQKDITVTEILTTTRRLKANGIPYSGSFVGGYPGETEEELEETLKLITTLFTENPLFVFDMVPYVPFPGTTAKNSLEAHGFSFPKKIEEWANFHAPHDTALASIRKTESFYNEFTPWLTESHKLKLFMMETLGQVAGRPLYRSKSFLGPLLAFPYNVLIHIARFRWRHRLFGPVPEEILMNFFRAFGVKLYRQVKGEFPVR